MVGSVGLRPGRLFCPRVHCASSVGGATRGRLVLRRNCRRRRRTRTALVASDVGRRPGRLCCPACVAQAPGDGATRGHRNLRRSLRRCRRTRTALVASDVGRRPGRLCCPRVRRASPSGRRDAGAPECTAQSPSMQTHPDRPCRQRCRSAARASMLAVTRRRRSACSRSRAGPLL